MSSASVVLQLPLRLKSGTGTYVDLMIELAPDATIGELADHLAQRFGQPLGQTILNKAESNLQPASSYLRSALIANCGPQAGETIRLFPPQLPAQQLPAQQLPAQQLPAQQLPALAPVFLHSVRDSALNDTHKFTLQLAYGMNHVHGAEIEVSERVEVRATGAVTPAVNGAPIMGSSRLGSGDLLNMNARLNLVQITGPLRPPAVPGPTQVHRVSITAAITPDEVTVSLPAPPPSQRLPGFPVLSAVVPLLMGAALWVATKSIATALFVLFSFVFVLASGLEARRESRAEQKFRLAEFFEDLAQSVRYIKELHRNEFAQLNQHVPGSDSLSGILSKRSKELWSRSVSYPKSLPMFVRLGTAQITAGCKLQVPTQGRRDLLKQLRQTASNYQLANLPSLINLDNTAGIGIVGRDELATALARSLVLQLAVALPPQDLQICVLTGQDRLELWRWCAWLPHSRSQNVSQRTLLVIDGAEEDLVQEAIQRYGATSTRVLWLAASQAGLPAKLGAVVELGEQPRLFLESIACDDPFLENSEAVRVVDLHIEDLTEDEAVPLARSLAPLVAHISPVQLAPSSEAAGTSGNSGTAGTQPQLVSSHLPAQVWLHQILAQEQMLCSPQAVLDQWAITASSSGLGAPLGRVANGVLHLDLRADGPHALIAGTTGSGKSELLRSLVASLALHHSPDRLTFLLVDYKGGAAFRTLTSLPHTVGLITDLSPQLAQRALLSLQAEVRYREARLAQLGISEITEVPKNCSAKVPPALIVVVDEFATLARELPEFVDGLVDLSQRGRSLGMHLVLATQRPAGVITDAIRANTALRIALRVADQEDSKDVVELPEAAVLPREIPGRAILRSGPGQCSAVQFAYSGSSRSAQPRILSWPLGDSPPHKAVEEAQGRPTDLDAAVASAVAAAALGNLQPPRPPWLDALPPQLALSQIHPLSQSHPAGTQTAESLAIGWCDRPEKQRRELLEINLDRDGGLLVLGTSGSGRSTTLRTTAQAAIIQLGAGVQIFGIDAASGLGPLAELAQVGAIIQTDETERVFRLLRRLASEIQTRLQSGSTFGESNSGFTMQLLLIDGFSAFEELYERVNRGEALDLLARIVRDGRSLGIHVLIAAHRRVDVPPRIAALLGCQIYLRRPTADDALMLGLDPNSAAPETPPGRGSQAGHQVQIAQLDEKSEQLVVQQPGFADDIAALPKKLRFTQLQQHAAGQQIPGQQIIARTEAWTSLVCGIEAQHLQVARLDLEHNHALIAGPPRSGKSTTLTTLAMSLADCSTTELGTASYLLAARHSSVHEESIWSGALIQPGSPQESAEFLVAAAESARSGCCTLVAVDDFCSLVDSPGGELVEQGLAALVELGRTHRLRVILSAEVDTLLRSYSELVAQLRSTRTGILLGIDPEVHASLLHASLPAQSELLPQDGRGWLLAPGTAQAVQFAQP
ncbi:MAG: FtsK/SpoIIIE domain-containing protein [Microthrixaceae bacterium]